MNIGICGLLPDQVRWVQQEFPQHALRFLDKDHESDAGTFAKGCDKVVLMTKFIGHHLQDRVQPSKRILVTGGTTKLKQVLSKLPTPVKTTTPPKETATKVKAPTGRGRWAGHDVIDWVPMLTANVGDTVRIARPSTLTLQQFQRRIEVGRSYRKTHNGIVTAVPKHVDGAALITVTAMQDAKPYKKGRLVAADETAPPDATPPEATQETEAMQIAVEVQRPVAAAPMFTQARDSAFWQSAFLEVFKQWPGAPVETIAARADEALRAYNARVSVSVMQQH